MMKNHNRDIDGLGVAIIYNLLRKGWAKNQN
jgi:hypothetical protein